MLYIIVLFFLAKLSRKSRITISIIHYFHYYHLTAFVENSPWLSSNSCLTQCQCFLLEISKNAYWSRWFKNGKKERSERASTLKYTKLHFKIGNMKMRMVKFVRDIFNAWSKLVKKYLRVSINNIMLSNITINSSLFFSICISSLQNLNKICEVQWVW